MRRVLVWVLRNRLIIGLGALVWLAARSATKPTRLSYPCQQAALANLTLALGLPLGGSVRALLARRGLRRRYALIAAAVGAIALGAVADSWMPLAAAREDRRAPARDYVAQLYMVEDAGGPWGDHHLGVDELIACMGEGGLKFYRSDVPSPEGGPEGVVGPADLVLIKVNQQWDERGGTNTDVLKGLIARVLEHPDGFSGEVLVIENTQNMGSMDWPNSNAEDHGQSTRDVVRYFGDQGLPVGMRRLDGIRAISVGEYAGGDTVEGYVVGPWEPTPQIRVSYPKFKTPGGRYLSLKNGIWDPGTASYSDSLVTFINVPIFKCHSIYGVTASVKHHVGTMTTALSTNTHAAVRYGGPGSFLGQVRMADLNILDCIYILARPGEGPGASYDRATRVDKLVAGLDPVALDIWATKNILVPTILANGYTSYPAQDPDNPSSIFRIYLDAAKSELLARGVVVTNDLSSINASICSPVGVPTEGSEASGPRLMAAYPNPSGAGFTIRFSIPEGSRALLEIYDPSGRLVRTLEGGDAMGASPDVAGERFWDGRDEAGRSVSPGSYFVRLSMGSEGYATERVIVIR